MVAAALPIPPPTLATDPAAICPPGSPHRPCVALLAPPRRPPPGLREAVRSEEGEGLYPASRGFGSAFPGQDSCALPAPVRCLPLGSLLPDPRAERAQSESSPWVLLQRQTQYQSSRHQPTLGGNSSKLWSPQPRPGGIGSGVASLLVPIPSHQVGFVFLASCSGTLSRRCQLWIPRFPGL